MRIFAMILLLFFTLSACQKPSRDFIDDRAGLLSPAARTRIAAQHRQLLLDLDLHLKLVILKEQSADLDGEALKLVEAGKVGGDTQGARGVLLLVDPQGEQVRLEIGYDLEPFFTDAFVGRIKREQMIPFFAAGRVGDGVEATVELLVAQTLRGGQEEPGPTTALPNLSGGGGAKSAAPIGSGTTPPAAAADAARYGTGATPLVALENYRAVLEGRIKDPMLPLYTEESQAFLARWLVTDAQQGQELRSLAASWEQLEVRSAGDYAVARFPVEARQTPPYLLRRSAAGWQLDLAAMSRLLAFNHLGEWHFRAGENPWRFAFADWRFDANGFPYERR